MENHPQDLAPVHLKDHLRILKRNKWTAVAFFCVVVGLTALYLLFSNPLYSAKVVLVLNPPPFSPLTMMSELIYAQGVDVVSRRLYVTTQFDVIKSRRMAEKVLDRLDLWDVYRVGQRKRGHVWRDPGTVTRERAAEELAKKVSVISPNIMSNSIELTVRNKDPERAARIANTLVEVYLEALYEDRERKIEENLNWLRREFNAIEAEVVDHFAQLGQRHGPWFGEHGPIDLGIRHQCNLLLNRGIPAVERGVLLGSPATAPVDSR